MSPSTGNQVTDMGWEVYPDGLCELLCRLNNDYDVGTLMVTENGAAFKDILEDGQVNDVERQSYIQSTSLPPSRRGVVACRSRAILCGACLTTLSGPAVTRSGSVSSTWTTIPLSAHQRPVHSG